MHGDESSSERRFEKPAPGDPIEGCTEAPTLRARDPKSEFKPREESVGYTSRGHVEHFLPDREVNLAQLNKALQDVFGEPGLRGTKLEIEIDDEYWLQICGDPWSGNIYRYHF
ncbi:MAG: hypothetical protein M3217_12085 [Actinomycetota bacterium]|nr:hypothetical protein [Actinomycetota bacterium]